MHYMFHLLEKVFMYILFFLKKECFVGKLEVMKSERFLVSWISFYVSILSVLSNFTIMHENINESRERAK